MSEKVRAIGYVRYSSDMQDDSFSLEAQERQIRQRAEQDGVELVAVYADPAQSAYHKRHRPGIKKMLEHAQRGEVDMLYVHKVDRLSRRLEWALDVVKELREAGVDLRAVEQHFDLTTPEGKLLFSFLCSLGEFYSDNLSLETHKGKYERAQQGFHNGWAPFGYKSVLVEGRRMAIPEEPKATAVREAFERYATGIYADQEIADWLNGQGFRTRRGRVFSKETIRAILQNPFYKGEIRYRGVFHRGKAYRSLKDTLPGRHEALVNDELFDKCQQVRLSRQQTVKTRQVTRRVYLLNRVAVCHLCKRKLRAQSCNNDNRYYREVSHLNGFNDCPWHGKSVRADVIDEQVSRLVQSLRLPEGWRATLNELLGQEEAAPDPEQEIARLRGEIRRMRNAYRNGLYENEEYLFWRDVEALQAQIAALQQIEPSQSEQVAAQLLSVAEACVTAGGKVLKNAK